MLKLNVEYDHGSHEWEDIYILRPVSFNTRHYNFMHPNEVMEQELPIAANLGYAEHGLCRWTRQGMRPVGIDSFDFVSSAGVLVIEDEDTWDRIEDKDAWIDAYLKEYTSWSNGEVYGYSLSRIECPDGFDDCPHHPNEELDSCWGYIGEWAKDAISDAVMDFREPGEAVEVAGEASDLFSHGVNPWEKED